MSKDGWQLVLEFLASSVLLWLASHGSEISQAGKSWYWVSACVLFLAMAQHLFSVAHDPDSIPRVLLWLASVALAGAIVLSIESAIMARALSLYVRLPVLALNLAAAYFLVKAYQRDSSFSRTEPKPKGQQ